MRHDESGHTSVMTMPAAAGARLRAPATVRTLHCAGAVSRELARSITVRRLLCHANPAGAAGTRLGASVRTAPGFVAADGGAIRHGATSTSAREANRAPLHTRRAGTARLASRCRTSAAATRSALTTTACVIQPTIRAGLMRRARAVHRAGRACVRARRG